MEDSRLIKDIKLEEGLQKKSYDDAGARSVGYGYNMTSNPTNARKDFKTIGADYDRVLKGTASITKDQADKLLELYMPVAEADAKSFISNYDSQPEDIKEVISQMSYQLGGPKLKGFKKLKAALEASDYFTAAKEMQDSKWAKDDTPARANRLTTRVNAINNSKDPDNIVSQEELTEYGLPPLNESELPPVDAKSDAIDNLKTTPEGFGDVDPSTITLDDMSFQSRESLIDDGVQLASTSDIPEMVPNELPPLDVSELPPTPQALSDIPSDLPSDLPEFNADELPPLDASPFDKMPPSIDSTSKDRRARVSQEEAILLGLSEGITFGFTDEIKGSFDAVFTEKTYEESRDAVRKMQESAARDWTKTYTGTQIAGGIVTSLIVPASIALKGVSSVGKIALQAGKAGAIEGAITGIGLSDKETAAQITLEAAIGAFAGGIGGAAVGAGLAKGSQVYKKWKSSNVGPHMGEKEAENIMVRAEQKALRDREGDIIEQTTMQTDDLEGILTDPNKWKNVLGEENLAVYKKNRGHVEKIEAEDYPISEADSYLLGDQKEAKLKEIRAYNESIDRNNIAKELDSVERRRSINSDLDATLVTDVAAEGSPIPIIKEELSDIDIYSMMAHAEYKLNTINFMKYVVRKSSSRIDSRAIREVALDETELSDKALKSLILKFKRAKDTGLVTKNTFTDFKAEQNMALGLRDKIDTIKAGILNNTEIKGQTFMPEGFEGPVRPAWFDPEEVARAEAAARRQLNKDVGEVGKKLLDAYTMANLIDHKLGSNAGRVVVDMYEAQNRSTAFMQNAIEFLQPSAKLRMKIKMKLDDVADAIEGKLTRGLSKEEEEVVDGYRTAFQLLLQSTNEAGANIPSRGRNYVPSRIKYGVEKINALENYYKEFGYKIDDDLIKSLRNKTDNQIEQIIKKKSANRDEILFIHHLEKHVNRGSLDIRSIEEVFEKGYLRTSESLDNAFKQSFELGLAKQRQDLIPDFLRERNVDVLFFGNADAATKQLFISPVAKRLDASIAVANELGAKKSARWMRNYQLDNLGLARGNLANINRANRAKFELWADGKGRLPQDAMAAADLMSTAIYGNLVGMNPSGVIRNLTQPLTMTAAEMGWLKGSSLLVKSYGSVVKKMAKGGWKNVVKEAEEMGLKPINVTSADLEGVRAGAGAFLKSSGWKTTKEVVDKYTNAAMFMFVKSDEINRVVTVEMSKRMAKEIASGSITKSTKKAIAKMPNSIKDKLRVLDKARSLGQISQEEVDREVTKSLAGHFIAGTQFIYGTAGKFELGRDLGPMFSMLTTWPVAISSNVYYKVATMGVTDGMKDVTRKYFAPLVVTSLLSRMLLEPDRRDAGPVEKVLVGKGGFQSTLPVHSMFSLTSSIVPVNIESALSFSKVAVDGGTDLISGRLNSKKQEALKRAGTRATQQFIPVLGGAWKAYERNIAPFMEEK